MRNTIAALSIIIVVTILLSGCSYTKETQTETLSNVYTPETIKEHASYTTSFPLVVEYQNRVFRFQYDKELVSENELFKLICDFFYGEQQLKNVIIEQLGDSSEIVVDSFNRTITIEFNLTKENGSIPNYAEPEARKIHIFGMNGLSSIYHELIHVVFGSCQYAWISEGNATYWPTYIDEEYYSLNSLSRYYQLLGKNIDNIYKKTIEEVKIKDRPALEAEYQLVHSWNDIYSNKLNIPETIDEFNYKTFTEAVGAACILNHDMLTKINESELLTKTVTHKSIEDYNYKNDPDGLNYYEAFLLFYYLKETYGMNTLFDYYNATISFEEAFGASYQELFPSFYNWVEDIYQ